MAFFQATLCSPSSSVCSISANSCANICVSSKSLNLRQKFTESDWENPTRPHGLGKKNTSGCTLSFSVNNLGFCWSLWVYPLFDCRFEFTPHVHNEPKHHIADHIPIHQFPHTPILCLSILVMKSRVLFKPL